VEIWRFVGFGRFCSFDDSFLFEMEKTFCTGFDVFQGIMCIMKWFIEYLDVKFHKIWSFVGRLSPATGYTNILRTLKHCTDFLFFLEGVGKIFSI